MMKEIPLLSKNDIECRIQSVSKNRNGKVGATLLLYKNARVDMRILDEVFGAENWQRNHEVVNGNLYCNVGAYVTRQNGYGEWVWKQDCGTPSNTEAEKGEASDSFKRACTNWGIGRELYTAPFIYVELNDGEYYEDRNGKLKAGSGVRFTVDTIEYNDRREITGLVVKDRNGGVAFSMGGKYKSKETKAEQKPEPKSQEYICEMCKKPIVGIKGKSPEYLATYTTAKYGHALCAECAASEAARYEKMNAELDQMNADFKAVVG